MITNPTDYISYFASCGAKYITMHIETLAHPIRAIKQVHETGCLAGIALNSATSVDTLRYLVDYADLILIMTVDPGFSGQELIPETINKITEICNLFSDNKNKEEIMIDGHVQLNTAKNFINAGANSLILGSISALMTEYHPEQYAKVLSLYRNL